MQDLVRLLLRTNINLIELNKAKEAWLAHRLSRGYVGSAPLLSSEATNMKLGKSANKLGIHTFGLSLTPAKSSEAYNVCRYATNCAKACVAFSGNGRYNKVKHARTSKVEFLAANPSAFVTLLVNEIDQGVNKYKSIAVRLNTFSDIPWEQIVPWFFDKWTTHQVRFYDYTKWPVSERPGIAKYDLTRSATEKHSNKEIKAMLDAGERVAVCLDLPKKEKVPKTWLDYPVVDGDTHDARFTEPKRTVVLLRPKGTARKHGFIRSLEV